MWIFVVPGNGQASLGKPDTDVLNIISINIHAIGAEDARDSEWYTNIHTIQGSKPRQETDREDKCCTNRISISKLASNNTKIKAEVKASKSAEYFLAGPTCDSNKRKSALSTQQIHKSFDDVFNSTGCFEDMFSLQLKPDGKPYQALHCRNHFKMN